MNLKSLSGALQHILLRHQVHAVRINPAPQEATDAALDAGAPINHWRCEANTAFRILTEAMVGADTEEDVPGLITTARLPA